MLGPSWSSAWRLFVWICTVRVAGSNFVTVTTASISLSAASTPPARASAEAMATAINCFFMNSSLRYVKVHIVQALLAIRYGTLVGVGARGHRKTRTRRHRSGPSEIGARLLRGRWIGHWLGSRCHLC